MHVYKFRGCYLNTIERQVIKDGKRLELTSKTYDVLELLVNKSGEIVTKEEILDRVWHGSFVEEANLPVHISKLRNILGKSKTEPYIETVQGSGYRFITPVQIVSEEEWQKHLPRVQAGQNEIQDKFDFDSIAVLPLQNENNDSAIDYLADGLTESFINSLSLVSNLRVIARHTVFPYKNKDVNIRELGDDLGVAAILTGRVRVIKDNLMISVELVQVKDGMQLWGLQFNQPFSDIPAIQVQIIAAASEKLKLEVSNAIGNTRKKPLTPDSESYRLYLKGKYCLEKRSLENIYKAIEFFRRSVSYDPTNILSYIETIESYILLYGFDHISHAEALVEIKPILNITSQFDQSIDVMQVMHGGISMYFDWNFKEAQKHFRRALQINPTCITAHYRYSKLMMIEGKFSEAAKELHQIILIDPLSITNYKRISKLFYCMKQYGNAINYLNEVLELEATDYEALIMLGASLTELGEYDEALSIFQKSLDLHYNIETLSMMGYANARAGRKVKTRQIIKRIQSQSKNNQRDAIKIARIYASLHETEYAYNFLEKAFSQHDVDLIALKSDPRWVNISHEPKFRELIRRVGFSVQ
jgi:TolB-like protein